MCDGCVRVVRVWRAEDSGLHYSEMKRIRYHWRQSEVRS